MCLRAADSDGQAVIVDKAVMAGLCHLNVSPFVLHPCPGRMLFLTLMACRTPIAPDGLKPGVAC
jgi:hypothetical protein